MATVVMTKHGIVRHNVPLDHVEYVGNGVLVRVRFPEDSIHPNESTGEVGKLHAQVMQAGGDAVVVWGSEEEWQQFLERVAERAEEARERMIAQQLEAQQAASAGKLVIPKIGVGRIG